MAGALKDATVRRADATPDLRWGAIFYDGKDARLLTLYFDRFGHGLINGAPVKSNGGFNRYLSRRCSCLWAGQYPTH